MAKRHLTEIGVKALKVPAKGQAEVFDLGYPGLAVRVSNGGAKSFILFHRAGGKLNRRTLGRWPEVSLARAREEWRRTRQAIARGDSPVANGKSELVFDTVVEEWLRRDIAPRNKQSSVYQITRAIERDLLPAWRGRRINTLTKFDVLTLLDGIADRGAPIKARRVYAHAHRFFKWCVSRGIITSSPMEGLEKPGAERSRDRVLSDDELARVWRGAEDGPFGTITKLLILTGARRDEITSLRWDEIQGDVITLEGARTKNGKPHLIPLSAPALALLRSTPRIGDHCFTVDGAKPVAAWSRPKARLDASSGVKGWVIHDLRRTVATGLQKLGFTLQTVEAVLGHVSGSRAGVAGIYQRHDFAAEKREALEAWGAHVARLTW
jgi:integrase